VKARKAYYLRADARTLVRPSIATCRGQFTDAEAIKSEQRVVETFTTRCHMVSNKPTLLHVAVKGLT
jgi:hypothetical protein